MIIPPDIQNKFKNTQRDIEVLEDIVKSILIFYCEKNNYPFVFRRKTIESISEKIETGRFRSWSDIDDFFGFTIIIPFLNEEPKVLEFLRERFSEVGVKLRGSTLKAPDVFRFDSTRFIATLKKTKFPNAPGNIKFEVQIKTAFDHAWSVTTHALAYKAETVDWKRLRLAAYLKSAVEQLDILTNSFEEMSEYIKEQNWPEIKAKSKIIKKFKDYYITKRLPSVQEPKDWSRFSDNVYHLLRNCRNLRNKNEIEKVNLCLEHFEQNTDELGAKAPLTLSLFQFIFGALYQNKIINKISDNYTIFISNDLETFYPRVKEISNRFVLEEFGR